MAMLVITRGDHFYTFLVLLGRSHFWSNSFWSCHPHPDSGCQGKIGAGRDGLHGDDRLGRCFRLKKVPFRCRGHVATFGVYHGSLTIIPCLLGVSFLGVLETFIIQGNKGITWKIMEIRFRIFANQLFPIEIQFWANCIESRNCSHPHDSFCEEFGWQTTRFGWKKTNFLKFKASPWI